MGDGGSYEILIEGTLNDTLSTKTSFAFILNVDPPLPQPLSFASALKVQKVVIGGGIYEY